MYSGATEANPLTYPASQYLGEIAHIARRRPEGAVSNIQGMRGAITELAEAGRLTGGQVEHTFFRFERAGADLSRVQERIYLNVNADRAPHVMEFVVRDIVDNPGKFPGVSMAKLAGPGSVSARAESIVIYAEEPGVASTAFLAYTIEEKQADPVEIPVGARSQTIPGPDELPQSSR